jgi:hypothetical protein
MKATSLSQHHREERNTGVGEGRRPSPALPRPPKPKLPPPAPPRCQPAAADKSYRRHHRTCLQPRAKTLARPSPSGPEQAQSSLSHLRSASVARRPSQGRRRQTRTPPGACNTSPLCHAPPLLEPEATASAQREVPITVVAARALPAGTSGGGRKGGRGGGPRPAARPRVGGR